MTFRRLSGNTHARRCTVWFALLCAPALAQETALEHAKPILNVDRQTCLTRATEALRQAGYQDVLRGGDTISARGEPAAQVDCHALSPSQTLATVMVAGTDATGVARTRAALVALLQAGGPGYQGVFGGTGNTGAGSPPTATTTDTGPGGTTTITTTSPWPSPAATQSTLPTLAGRWQWSADCSGSRFQGQWTIRPGNRSNEYVGTFGQTNQYDVGNFAFVVTGNRIQGTRTFEAGGQQRRQDWTGALSQSGGGAISGWTSSRADTTFAASQRPFSVAQAPQAAELPARLRRPQRRLPCPHQDPSPELRSARRSPRAAPPHRLPSHRL